MSQVVVSSEPSTFRKRRYSTMGYAKSNRPAKRQRMNNAPGLYKTVIDYKVTDSSYAVGIDYTGEIISLIGNLTRGDDYKNNFSGGRITPVGLEARYNVSVADSSNIVRVMIFQWFDKTTPTTATVLETVGSTYAVHSAKFLTNRDNIKILSDKCYAMDTYNTVVVDKVYIKGKKLTNIEFPTGAVTAQKGGLYMLFVSDSAAAANPGIDLYTRITFTDK